jgi:hypothetical protein
MSEYRRKTLRSFYCDEQLWKAYERLARERDTTIDQVLAEALEAQLGAPQAPAPVIPQAGPALNAEPRPTMGERMTMERMSAVRPVAAPAPPPPPRAATRPTPAVGGPLPRLFLHYDGRAYPVQQERFVIGRGSQGTDFTIRDGNISRKHAVIMFHNGGYYIQDLGSTNGVEYRGQRIDTKLIEEGDVFSICDHALTFSYRG